jgi:ribosomal protein L44E
LFFVENYGGKQNATQSSRKRMVPKAQLQQKCILCKNAFLQRNHGGCAKMFSNTVIIVAKMA